MHSLSQPGCQNCGAVPLSVGSDGLSSANSFDLVEDFSPLPIHAATGDIQLAGEHQALLNKMHDVCTASNALSEGTHDLSHQVLTMIMHDIKSPLSTIQLCLEIIEALAPCAEGDDPVSRALVRAQANIERVQRLADDVLMQEKIRSGTLELNAKTISLECVVKNCIDSLTAVTQVRNISIVVEGVRTVVFADKIRLEQILQNLLCNAISFSPPGSAVRLSAEKQHIDSREHVVIRVEDSGPGVPESIRLQLFKPFQQFQNGMERCGTYGLGLSICQMLVGLHKGKIWVEANSGQGCIFCIALPCY